jgi:hypothetical protein
MDDEKMELNHSASLDIAQTNTGFDTSDLET